MVACDHYGALHRCSDLVGRPCSISAIRFHAPSFTPLPTAALYLKRSRQGCAASSSQLDRRVAYDGSGRGLVGEIAAKQKRNHWSSWEWCEGATTALVKKELLKPRVMSAALKGALGTAHVGAREPIRVPDDPAGQVAAAGQPPTPPPSMIPKSPTAPGSPAAADEPAPGTAPMPGTAPDAATTGTKKQRRRARKAARKQRREAKGEAKAAKGADEINFSSEKRAGGGGGGGGDRAIAKRQGGGGGGGGGGVDGEDDDAPAAEGAWGSTTRMTSSRRIEGEASTLVHERQSHADVQIEELLRRCEAQLVRRTRVAVAKRFRCTIKMSLALETARQRLMIHLSTLAEPTLKPNKAIEATDRRRLLGDLEIPQLACSTVQVG